VLDGGGENVCVVVGVMMMGKPQSLSAATSRWPRSSVSARGRDMGESVSLSGRTLSMVMMLDVWEERSEGSYGETRVPVESRRLVLARTLAAALVEVLDVNGGVDTSAETSGVLYTVWWASLSSWSWSSSDAGTGGSGRRGGVGVQMRPAGNVGNAAYGDPGSVADSGTESARASIASSSAVSGAETARFVFWRYSLLARPSDSGSSDSPRAGSTARASISLRARGTLSALLRLVLSSPATHASTSPSSIASDCGSFRLVASRSFSLSFSLNRPSLPR
jgi:hypothetical protein